MDETLSAILHTIRSFCAGEISKRCFHSENASNVLRPSRRNLKTQLSVVIMTADNCVFNPKFGFVIVKLL